MKDILRISVPLTAWLAAFTAVYAFQGLVCSDRWSQAGLDLAAGRAALTIAWAAAAALQAAFLLALLSPRFGSPSPFVRRVSLVLAVAALAATLWTLAPVAVTTTCR